jgi:hypothetical protein
VVQAGHEQEVLFASQQVVHCGKLAGDADDPPHAIGILP